MNTDFRNIKVSEADNELMDTLQFSDAPLFWKAMTEKYGVAYVAYRLSR